MSLVMKRGAFITLEGIDGCGKSTQGELLSTALAARLGAERVIRTHEPGGWRSGSCLRELLLAGEPLDERTELLLFLADRSGHLNSTIVPALEQGTWVLCERYTDSTLAYQSWGRGIALDSIKRILQWCKFVVPDLTIFLDVDTGEARRRMVGRGAVDRIESARDGFMERVALGFRQLAAKEPERIVTVDAALPVNQLAQHLLEIVTSRFDSAD